MGTNDGQLWQNCDARSRLQEMPTFGKPKADPAVDKVKELLEKVCAADIVASATIVI